VGGFGYGRLPLLARRGGCAEGADAWLFEFHKMYELFRSGPKPLIRAIDREAARNNNRFLATVLGIVKSDTFQMNSK
jgi:hypothetical protein